MNKNEKQLLGALEEAKKWSNKAQEREDKKLWSSVNLPISLHDALSRYTKDDLDDIRKYLEIPNASSLKKAELIDVLKENIPFLVEKAVSTFDKNQFALIKKMLRGGGSMVAPSIENYKVRILQSTGLIYSGTFEGKPHLFLPQDLMEPLSMVENNFNVMATIKRNTEWIKLVQGMFYYYGVMDSYTLVNKVEAYTNKSITTDAYDFFSVIKFAANYYREIRSYGGSYIHYRVEDPDKIKSEQKFRKSVDFYPFTKEQLLLAGEPDYVEKNEYYHRFVKFILETYEIDQSEAEEIVADCVYGAQEGESLHEILEYIQSRLEFDSLESIQECADYVVELINNTKEWYLKGYAPLEIRKTEPKPKPSTSAKKAPVTVDVKVGRNEPCPCGSGKKYKKCCGR